MKTHYDIAAPTEIPLSKTRQKQAMTELQELGAELVALSGKQLVAIELPEELREAVRVAQGMTRHDEARRRQIQYVGRLMREVDPEPLRAALSQVRGDSAQAAARLHRLEKLRADLLADENALGEIAALFPAADLQRLRTLRRAALKERKENKVPRSFREIFRQLDTEDKGTESKITEHEP